MKRPDRSGERQAQVRFGTTKRAQHFAETQLLDHLNSRMRDFIACQDMMFIATANAAGASDCSFRAGNPGFVQVLTAKQLAFPEYRGNGVFASLGNILENPNIGMLFLDVYESTVGLHVNGQARVLDHDEISLLPILSSGMIEASRVKSGRRPEAWIIIDVEEAYIHCSKHVPLMKRLDKQRAWGSDDESMKGGDFFNVRA